MTFTLTPMAALLILLATFLITALLLKVPIGFSMLIACCVTMVVGHFPLFQLSSSVYTRLDSFTMLAMAFFIFSGNMMLYTGISRSLINWFDSLVGRIRGSLGMVTVLASAAFGSMTGTALSTLNAIGTMMIPEMEHKGYSPAKAAAICAATSFLGILIPPSNPGIMYAMAAECNILDVWMSTVGPGIVFVILYCLWIWIDRRKVEEKTTEPFVFSKYMKNAGIKTKDAFFAILMPLIIFGGIYSGGFTPTEAGAVSCAYGLCYFLVKKLILKRPMPTSKGLSALCTESAAMVGRIAMILVFSAAFGRVIALTGASSKLASLITENIHSKFLFLLLVNVLFLILGTFMELNAAVLIMTPLLLPAAKAMGVDPVHFGAIAIVNMSVGVLTPPLGINLSVAAKMANVSFSEAVKEAIPYIIIGLIVILLTTYCPQLVLWLPNMVN